MTNFVPSVDYHGAHKKPVAADAVQRWEGPNVVAFVHDLMTSQALPAEYAACDVFVADLPWQNGFRTFNQRAGVTDKRTYPQFMRRVAEIVEATTVPLYLVTGRHASRLLPAAEVELPMRLNEDDAVAYGWRPGTEAGGRYGIAQELLRALAERYASAGDFCCGYGRTGRFFVRAGKSAVLSDVNPQCVGYVAAHAAEWVR